MAIEIDFPFEVVIVGAARSLQASATSKQAWKTHIRQRVSELLPEGAWATIENVHVTIYYFPDAEMDGDIDNIIKPILDAFSGPIYIDDRQVERIVVQKFEPDRFDQNLSIFIEPSEALAGAIGLIGPRVYIKIEVADSWDTEDDRS
jgi:Holliday junction resolvase RusA-like endonuclease